MLFVHQCAAGLAHVKSNIRSNEAIHLSTAPGSPGAAKTSDDSCTRRDVPQHRTADGQHELPDARTLETDGLGRFQAVGLYAKHREIRSRIPSRNTGVESLAAAGHLDSFTATQTVTHSYDDARSPHNST